MRNFIGKFYRPDKFIRHSKKELSTNLKYKSNLSGQFSFVLNLNLKKENKNEFLEIEIIGDNKENFILEDNFKKLDNNTFVSYNKNKNITTERIICMPNLYSSTVKKIPTRFFIENKCFCLDGYIYSNKDSECDFFRLKIEPVAKNNKEFFKIYINSSITLKVVAENIFKFQENTKDGYLCMN